MVSQRFDVESISIAGKSVAHQVADHFFVDRVKARAFGELFPSAIAFRVLQQWDKRSLEFSINIRCFGFHVMRQFMPKHNMGRMTRANVEEHVLGKTAAWHDDAVHLERAVGFYVDYFFVEDSGEFVCQFKTVSSCCSCVISPFSIPIINIVRQRYGRDGESVATVDSDSFGKSVCFFTVGLVDQE